MNNKKIRYRSGAEGGKRGEREELLRRDPNQHRHRKANYTPLRTLFVCFSGKPGDKINKVLTSPFSFRNKSRLKANVGR